MSIDNIFGFETGFFRLNIIYLIFINIIKKMEKTNNNYFSYDYKYKDLFYCKGNLFIIYIVGGKNEKLIIKL